MDWRTDMVQIERQAGPPAPAPEVCPVCGGAPVCRREVVRAGTVAVCGSCGSYFRVPRPAPAQLGAIYDKGYYDSWGVAEDEAIARAAKTATFLPVIRRIEHLLGCTEGAGRRLLDVGAATGLLLLVARQRGWTPFAVEINPYSAGVLRQQVGPQNVFEGDLTGCPFPPGSFDAMTMTDVIEHVPDVPATLRAARRLLRSGGVLCLTTPRIDSFTRWVMRRNWLHYKLEHIQYFSAGGIRRALEELGLADVRISGHWKRLSLDYLHTQLKTYRHWALTPVVSGLWRVLPACLCRRPFGYLCGEMLVTARVPNG
jgi:SAM-dependent methyltransferase